MNTHVHADMHTGIWYTGICAYPGLHVCMCMCVQSGCVCAYTDVCAMRELCSELSPLMLPPCVPQPGAAPDVAAIFLIHCRKSNEQMKN